MPNSDHRHPGGRRTRRKRGSASGVLEKVADAGSSLTGSTGQIWHAAREGTQELAEVLPDAGGLDHVKEFIRRHPVVSTCAALAVGYMLIGAWLPLLGTAVGVVRGRR